MDILFFIFIMLVLVGVSAMLYFEDMSDIIMNISFGMVFIGAIGLMGMAIWTVIHHNFGG